MASALAFPFFPLAGAPGAFLTRFAAGFFFSPAPPGGGGAVVVAVEGDVGCLGFLDDRLFGGSRFRLVRFLSLELSAPSVACSLSACEFSKKSLAVDYMYVPGRAGEL